jgi:hypothetical protein
MEVRYPEAVMTSESTTHLMAADAMLGRRIYAHNLLRLTQKCCLLPLSLCF